MRSDKEPRDYIVTILDQPFKVNCIPGKAKTSAMDLYALDPKNREILDSYSRSYLYTRTKVKVVLHRSHGPKDRNKKTYPCISKSGYRIVETVNGKHRSEHRVVMEQILGRELRKGERPHHKNLNRADNRPENLELWIVSHPSGARARDLLCPHCGKSYLG